MAGATPKRGVRSDQNGMSSSMSLLRAPAATGRRGAELTDPPEPKSPPASSEPKLPPPPARPSSMVRVELKPCSTTSVEYFLDAALSRSICGSAARLDVNLRALLQILLRDLAKPFVEDDDAVPLGLFLALAGRLVAPGFRRRDAQIGDRTAILRPPDFRVLAEIADQNHLVNASRHRRSPLKKSPGRPTPAATSVVAHRWGIADDPIRRSKPST